MRKIGRFTLSIGVVMVLLWISGCRTLVRGPQGSRSGEDTASVEESGKVDYYIDHRLQGSGDLPSIAVEHGEIIRFEIRDTDPDCYFYNAQQIMHPDLGAAEAAAPVVLEIVHDESVAAYAITVSKRPNSEERCSETRSWKVPVMATWNLAGAAGPGLHDLIDPTFYLEPGERTKADGQKEQGYYVRRNRDVEDSNRFTGAAFAHLFRASRGWNGVSWAPLSVGLSVASGDESYLLGTTLRFGRKFYLTGGKIFGTVDRLPDDLSLNGFTTDHSLGTLPTRRTDGWFLGFTYGFLESGISDLFKTKVGVPSATAPPATGGQTTPGRSTPQPVALVVAPAQGPPGAEVVISPPEGESFGGRDDDAVVVLGATTLKSTHQTVSWAPEKIQLKIPEDASGEEIQITVRKVGADGKPFDFGVVIFKLEVPEEVTQ